MISRIKALKAPSDPSDVVVAAEAGTITTLSIPEFLNQTLFAKNHLIVWLIRVRMGAVNPSVDSSPLARPGMLMDYSADDIAAATSLQFFAYIYVSITTFWVGLS